MKSIKFIILIVLCCTVAYSQKVCKYHYVLNEHIASTDSMPLFGIEQEFTTARKYYSPFIFSETRLFTGDNRKSILYKVENGIWYYKQKNKWKLFYNYKKMMGGDISLFGIRYKIKFESVVNCRFRSMLTPHSVSC